MKKKLKGVNPKDKFGLKKVPLRFLPPVAMVMQSVPHFLGSETKGYKPYNWRDADKPIRYSVYLEAMLRHLLLIMDGEDADEESLVQHEASIMAGCAIVMDAKMNDNLIDDRHKTGTLRGVMKEIEQTLVRQQEEYAKKKAKKK